MGVVGRVLIVCAAWCFMNQVHSVPFHISEGLSSIRSSASTPPLTGVYSECGKSKKTEANRLSIVNGQDALLGDWPWIVGFFFRSPRHPKPTFLCGGSLISNQWIITAAHCFMFFSNSSDSLVRLGDLDFDNQVMDGASPIEAQVDEIVLHPQFSMDGVINDIALVRLKNPVRFSENIRPICLLSGQEYKTNEYYYGKESIIIGWGQTVDSINSDTTSKLQEASINIVEQEVCKKDPQLAEYHNIDEKIICAGGTGKSSCHGDSGGPLMFLDDAEERFYVGGITSAGNPLGCSKSPVLYTKVAQFICWINEVTGEDF